MGVLATDIGSLTALLERSVTMLVTPRHIHILALGPLHVRCCWYGSSQYGHSI